VDCFGLSGGGEEEDRTPDLRIANAALSQLSYPPNAANYSFSGALREGMNASPSFTVWDDQSVAAVRGISGDGLSPWMNALTKPLDRAEMQKGDRSPR
jgi:hypothetical protein